MLDLSEIYQKSPPMSARLQEAFANLMASKVLPEHRPKNWNNSEPSGPQKQAERARKKRKEDALELVRLRGEGMSLREIHRVTGWSRFYIDRITKDMG